MIRKPYLLFVGDETRYTIAKTALGVRDWALEDCIGQFRISATAIDLGLPDMTPAAAAAAGAKSLVVGVAPIGGGIPESWVEHFLAALGAGLDIVSGLHQRLSAIPEVASRARALGRRLHDVRHADRTFPVATGVKRSGRRLLTVGTDCALGKKYTALSITKALQARGVAATFRATGQTGIMIAGAGVAIDAVVADFIAGAAETLSPDAAVDHWDVIEGQGAIFHPAYAGVTLGLLHGSQPDALILCHDPNRSEISSYPGFSIREVDETMATYVSLARVTNAAARFVGISLNTAQFEEKEAKALAEAFSARHRLPCFDPMRFGIESVLDDLVSL
jgi:uncharacterized NAD-dependent epimerase/dehydratase family protein